MPRWLKFSSKKMFSSLTPCCTLFLILFFYQAYGQYKRSLHLRVTSQKEFRCIDLSCQPFETIQANHRLACLQGCIARELCRTVNFISVNKTCELFFETPATHGTLLLNLNAYVMVVSDGSRFPEGKFFRLTEMDRYNMMFSHF